MIQKIKKPVSILLTVLMVFSVFAVVPFTASAAVGDYVAEEDYLTFTAEEAGSSVTLNVSTGSNLKYNLNGAGWESYSKGTQITLANVGDSVRFRGKDTTFNYSNHVSIGGKVACSGNVMSLRLDDNGKNQGLSYGCFNFMFKDCAGLTAAPELPETTLAVSCYNGMFQRCTSLTTAPELPATMLAPNCYGSMFYGCGNLTTAPQLPATTLAGDCYSNMFNGCERLTTAPELPATSLASNCYYGMFNGCERLTTAPELPATTLAYNCYCYMFYGCERLTTAPDLPATELAPYCYNSMFYGCKSIKLSETQTAEYSIPYSVPSGGNGTTASSSDLTNMFYGTGGTFTGTPAINTTYYRPAEKYTVTWKNEDGTSIDTTSVYEGDVPTHADPTKAEDANYTYTFSGWTPEVTAVTGDITYTAQFTAVPKLFVGHSVSLGGDIGVNFFLNPAVLDTYTGTKTVKFTVDGKETTVDVPATADANGYTVTCNVVAAQMAHKISAVVYVGDTALDQTDSYSVQDYAETVFKNPAAYDDKDKPDELKELAQALLNYGAMAQTVFYSSLKEHPDLANKTVGNNGYADVTADDIAAAINGEASDLNAIATDLGAKYFTNSLIYLSKNTLRVYFIPTTDEGVIPNATAYDGNLSNFYYYVDHADIPAAELDDQQTFTVGNTNFTFSALDYAKAVVESTKMEPDQQNLAKALYLYNQKANAYFDDAPAPAQKIVDLSTVTEDTTVEDGYTITGTLQGDYKISIADDATVTLKDVNITCLTWDAEYAGITPLGDATINLEGTNTVKTKTENPAIFVPGDKTLTIDGDGSLTASAERASGIGSSKGKATGNIVINGGSITVIGGFGSAGIGSCNDGIGGNITITGGTIKATGGLNAPAIGGGYFGKCQNINITGGTVTAIGGSTAPGIGSGQRATCGNITIANTVTQVTATKGNGSPDSIGAGAYASCGTVTIEDGANVTQN